MSNDVPDFRALVASVEQAAQDVDFAGLAQTFKYGKNVIAAYKWWRLRRVRTFLHGIGASVDDLPHEDRVRFDQYINSEEGGELLADFVERVVRNRSRTALAVLAVVFATPADQSDYEWKAETAAAFDGIPERNIDAFLALYGAREAIFHAHTQDLSVTNETVELVPALRAIQLIPYEWVAVIDDLVSRGLFGRDPVSAGRIGGGHTWSRYFIATPNTDRYAVLLLKARRCLESGRIL